MVLFIWHGSIIGLLEGTHHCGDSGSLTIAAELGRASPGYIRYIEISLGLLVKN
jgi:uncharacterized protein (DUF39 family)